VLGAFAPAPPLPQNSYSESLTSLGSSDHHHNNRDEEANSVNGGPAPTVATVSIFELQSETRSTANCSPFMSHDYQVTHHPLLDQLLFESFLKAVCTLLITTEA
jgi:hypothetical protein